MSNRRTQQGRWWFGGLLGIAVLAIAGCGGGQTNDAPLPGVPASNTTGTFFANDDNILVGTGTLVHVARSFVTIENRVPKQVGLVLFADAVKGIPQPPFDKPAIYGVNLPPESVYTPFTYLAFSYWSGHPPKGTGDAPHFHPLFGMSPPQQPDAGFVNERKPVAPQEIPRDYVNSLGISAVAPEDAFAPGIGLAYEDVVLPQPQLLPGWDTVGQNYFFYGGHMSGIGLGATNHYLIQQEQGQAPPVPPSVFIIKQPQVYPRPGYYPHHWSLTYDPKQRAHTFLMDDFQLATNVLASVAKR